MEILAKTKRRSVLIGILFAILIIAIVYAANYYKVDSGATSTIDEHGVCKKVTNNNALDIFVPTKTADEWTAFRNNASGVTLADCLYCQDSDGDGYGVCPNCGIAAGCTYDGDDCCDTDANANPGQTNYFSSVNACGSWDYDCSGAIEKSGCTYTTGSCSGTCYCHRWWIEGCPNTAYNCTCTKGNSAVASCGVSGHDYSGATTVECGCECDSGCAPYHDCPGELMSCTVAYWGGRTYACKCK